ncbi:MAG: DUF3078 domain-containing protein [Bacteroidetes bacterium]|nr:MAG: DUF3078 domain-containing protein [Bacteroidota bacterium]
MKAVIAWCVLVLMSTTVRAQEQAMTDSVIVPAWKPSLIAKVSGSQVGFQNWAEGGVNTLGLTLGVDGKLERVSDHWLQTHELRLGYGIVKQDTIDVRKSEDVIRLSMAFEFTGGGIFGKMNPTFAILARSQFNEGFNYQKNPFGDEREPPIKVSDFLSPGTFQQSIGLTYSPSDWFKQRVGLGAKETVVLIEELRPLYNLDADNSVRFEMGLESFTEVEKEIFENVHYKSTLVVFAAFNQLEKPDFLWENLVAMKVNDWLSVNLEWVVLYDTDVNSKAQFKEIFSVGVSYILI